MPALPSRLLAIVAVAVLALAACDDQTRQYQAPVADVAIVADGSLRIDGRPIDPDRLDRELARRAADANNGPLGRTDLQVRIRYAPGTDYQRVLALQERCLNLGIEVVQVQR